MSEVITTRLGHAQVEAVVSGTYPVSCTDGENCKVVEATTLRGAPVVFYQHGGGNE